MVKWHDQDAEGNAILASCTETEAIRRARAAGRSRGYEYDDDAAALDDFLVVNWAWIE